MQSEEKVMTLEELCNSIKLYDNVKDFVIEYSKKIDNIEFMLFDAQIRNYINIDNAVHTLINDIGEDENKYKILTYELMSAVKSYKYYMEKGIPEDIYIATMKCFTRFIKEAYELTGRYIFSSYAWAPRQAAMHLFRIGELEYDLRPHDMVNYNVHIHVPTDVSLEDDKVQKSLDMAEIFFRTFFGEYNIGSMIIKSWLLDASVASMLKEGSNILKFRNRFEIVDEGESTISYLKYVYKTTDRDINNLCENTSLQREMKKFLLGGGEIKDSIGKIIVDFS